MLSCRATYPDWNHTSLLEPQPDAVRVDRIGSLQQAKAIQTVSQFGEMDESWLGIYSFVPEKFTVVSIAKL